MRGTRKIARNGCTITELPERVNARIGAGLCYISPPRLNVVHTAKSNCTDDVRQRSLMNECAALQIRPIAAAPAFASCVLTMAETVYV
jgi:hypothetical protein